MLLFTHRVGRGLIFAQNRIVPASIWPGTAPAACSFLGCQRSFRRSNISTRSNTSGAADDQHELSSLLNELKKLNTAALCDADKSINSSKQKQGQGQDETTATTKEKEKSPTDYQPIILLDSKIRSLNHFGSNHESYNNTMVGVARTIQCRVANDFLAVLDSLSRARRNDVLVINTKMSVRAVAGELFCAEAARRGVRGIVVLDGPMRDTSALKDFFPAVRCYAPLISPYSGTTAHLGDEQIDIQLSQSNSNDHDDNPYADADAEKAGTTKIRPGDVIVGDNDGILAAPQATWQRILPIAKDIQAAEEKIRDAIVTHGGDERSTDLHSLTNYSEHVEAIQNGEPSSLKFLV